MIRVFHLRSPMIAAGVGYMLAMVVMVHCAIAGNLGITISPLTTTSRDQWSRRIPGIWSYDCTEMYTLFRLAQAFDPSFAATSLTRDMVEEMAKITPLASHGLIPGLLKELPQYLMVAATTPGFDRN